MSRTRGIHWSFTTYGNWLHGDHRGSWHGGQLFGPDPLRECKASMTNEAIILDAHERHLVAQAIGRTVTEEGYRVLAATIQPVHVHLLFAPLRVSVKKVIAQLKYRSAHAVLSDRSDRSLPRPRSLWATGRFPVFIFTETHLFNAIEYIRDHNRRSGLPADPFDWIDPLYPPSEISGERIESDSRLVAPIW